MAVLTVSARGRYASLDALRGLAVLMVVYDHLFAIAGERMAGGVFAPVPSIRHWVTGPLGIIQDFGWFGVCLFFFISGFVIAHSARQESIRVFAVRRIFRIFPPLVVAVLVCAVVDRLLGTVRPPTDYLWGLSLAGYFRVPQIVVLGVAWTLVIEVLFYALIALVSPLLKTRRPVWAMALASTVPLLVVVTARKFGDSYFLFAASMAYVPLLLMGSTLFLRRVAGLGLFATLALLAANYLVFVHAVRSIHTDFLPMGNSYLVSAAYALTLFVLCLDLGAPRALKLVGDWSYSLYLLHGTVGFLLVQQALATGAGAIAPYAASAVCIAFSWLMYRFIERPSISLGKRLAA